MGECSNSGNQVQAQRKPITKYADYFNTRIVRQPTVTRCIINGNDSSSESESDASEQAMLSDSSREGKLDNDEDNPAQGII